MKGVGGTWKDLTDSVNTMAANLTGQVRGVVTAVAQGAYEMKRILLTNVPGDYVTIGSALGEATPLDIIVLNTTAANMRTEGLLKQSQLLTGE